MSDERKIEPGDVVALASGGPQMTVAKLDTEFGVECVECQWWDPIRFRLVEARFAPTSLRHGTPAAIDQAVAASEDEMLAVVQRAAVHRRELEAACLAALDWAATANNAQPGLRELLVQLRKALRMKS